MSDVTDKLKDLAELLREGLITREEFDNQKQKLLSGDAPSLSGPTRMPTLSVDPLSGSTQIAPTDSLPPQLGSYRILETIGEGGMGKVVRARHVEESWAKRQGGDVVIKLVHPHLAADTDFRERFLDEADLGRRLQHPSLARVHAVIAEDTWLGAVMDYVEGQTLTEHVISDGVTPDRLAALLQPIAEALDYLHEQGIIHRDLKPDNVKIRPDGRPVILDLGIAKDTQSSDGRTRTSTAMGTTAWMAPEQHDAKNVTPAADRYALGMMAYVLLSGRLPWDDGTSETRIGMAKLMGQLTPLTQVAPDVDPGVALCVMTMLAVDPEDRYPTCAAFVAALLAPPADAVEQQRAEEEARRAQQAEAERQAAEAAEKQAAQERAALARKVAEEAKKKAEAERLAAEEAKQKRAEEAAVVERANRLAQENAAPVTPFDDDPLPPKKKGIVLSIIILGLIAFAIKYWMDDVAKEGPWMECGIQCSKEYEECGKTNSCEEDLKSCRDQCDATWTRPGLFPY